jgi:aurora kinase
MANALQSLMSGMTLDPSSPTPPPRKQSSASANPTNASTYGNRLPPLLHKYMNPGLVRPPNTGLTSSQHLNTESQRAPLLRLAGLNVPSPARTSKGFTTSSPKGKVSISQHTAKGIHGPAHSTTSRVMASSTTVLSNPAGGSQHVVGKKIDIGQYDGGFEVDDGKEVISGESAKILAMDSSSNST